MTEPLRRPGRLTNLKQEARIYLRHVLALFLPGIYVPVFEAYRIEPSPLDGWQDQDFNLLIDEGRRQLDVQREELERVRARGQFLFTTAGALLAVMLGFGRRVVRHESITLFLLWSFGALLVTLGLLGAASLMTARGEFGAIDTRLLSATRPPVLEDLARAYPEQVGPGENTLATRIAVFRDAATLVVLGAIAQAVTWLWTL
jgi:hypothetical protein